MEINFAGGPERNGLAAKTTVFSFTCFPCSVVRLLQYIFFCEMAPKSSRIRKTFEDSIDDDNQESPKQLSSRTMPPPSKKGRLTQQQTTSSPLFHRDTAASDNHCRTLFHFSSPASSIEPTGTSPNVSPICKQPVLLSFS